MVDAPRPYSVAQLESRMAVLGAAERALLDESHDNASALLRAACWASVMLIRDVSPAIREAHQAARRVGSAMVEERPINVFRAFNKVAELRRVGDAARRAEEKRRKDR